MKIGLAQMNSIFEDKEKNKRKCLFFLERAADEGIELILFPEMTLTGFSMNVDKIGEADDESLEWFKNMAMRFNLYIGFGHVEKTKDKGRNLLSIVSPQGIEIARYAKIHPFSYGKENDYYIGGEELCFVNIDNVNISSFICYDLRFPEIFQIASKKAELIIVIANWPEKRKEHWITLLKARAIENQCFIAGVNRSGFADSINYSGDSMIIEPGGKVVPCSFHLIKTEEGEEESLDVLICGEIDTEEVKKLRSIFTIKADRKENLYDKLNSSFCNLGKCFRKVKNIKWSVKTLKLRL